MSDSEIIQFVKKDSTSRLRAELGGCFPTSLTADQIDNFSRDELIDLVSQCRIFCKQTGKVTSSLEGKLTLKMPVGAAAPAVPAVVTDPMAMLLAFMKSQADERKLQSEKEAADRKLQADRYEAEKVERAAERKLQSDRLEAEKTEKEAERKLQADREEAARKLQAEQLAADRVEREAERKLQEDREEAARKIQAERADREEVWRNEQLALEARRIKAQEAKDAAEKALRKEELDNIRRQMEERWKDSLSVQQAHEDTLLERRSRFEDRIDIRVKNASAVLKNTCGILPTIPIDIPVWLWHLNRQFKLNNIADELRLPLINQLLNDRARKLVSRLPDDITGDYESLTAAILREFQLTPAKYREHFLSISKRSDETFSQLSTRIEVSLKYYLESRKIELGSQNKDICNLLVSDRIKECIPDYLQDFIRAQELKKWLPPDELCNALDTFCVDQPTKNTQSSHQQRSVSISQSKQSTTPSESSSRPAPLKRTSKMICSRCTRPGHTSPNCVTQLTPDQLKEKLGGKTKGGGFKVWKSKVNAVKSSTDSQNSARPIPSHVKCYECGENHYRSSCPNLQNSKVNRVTCSPVQDNSCLVQKGFNNSTESLNFHQLENDVSDKRSVNRVCSNANNCSDKTMNSFCGNENSFSSPVDSLTKVTKSVTIKEAKELSIVLDCNGYAIPGIIDTGAQVSVISKALLPKQVLYQQGINGYVSLQPAFGKPVKCSLMTLPLKLVSHFDEVIDPDKIVCTDIVCAVTDQLSENQILLTLDDYDVLSKASKDIIQECDFSETPVLCDEDFTLDSSHSCLDNSELSDVSELSCNLVQTRSQSRNISTEVSDLVDPIPIIRTIPVSDTVSSFAALQRADDSLKGCFDQLCDKRGPFFLDTQTGILFKRRNFRDETRDLLVLPTCKRREVLSFAHDRSGHFGIKKTTQLISRHFSFPRLKLVVSEYIQGCLECAKKRKITCFDNVPIRPVEKPTTSFDIVALDVYGPINPPSSRGHAYVLGIVCLQTRWVELFPLKHLKSTDILDAIMKFISYAGIPRVIISDNASNLVSDLNKLVYDRLGIEMRNSTVYHSEGNSVIERFWLSFKSMLTHVINSNKPREWDLLIPSLLFSYRNLPNEITGLSPYMMVFGKNCRSGLDVMYDLWCEKDLHLPKLNKSDTQFIIKLRENLKIAQESAIEHSKPLEKAYIEHYNKRAKEKSFEPGAQVLVLMPDSSSKLKSRWQGPYVVSKRLSDYSYLIVSLEDNSIRAMHANKLREFIPRVQSIGIVNDDDIEFGKIVSFPETETIIDEFQSEIQKLDFSHLTDEQRVLLLNVLTENKAVFSNEPGDCKPEFGVHKIVLTDGLKPKVNKFYRMTEKLKCLVDEQIDSLSKSRCSFKPHMDFAGACINNSCCFFEDDFVNHLRCLKESLVKQELYTSRCILKPHIDYAGALINNNCCFFKGDFVNHLLCLKESLEKQKLYCIYLDVFLSRILIMQELFLATGVVFPKLI